MRRMLRVVLFQPEIPPNTGNIMRRCANTGCSLHLVEPLGFELDDRRLRRAGLDYHEFAEVRVYPDLESFCEANDHPRLLALTTRGAMPFHRAQYGAGDAVLFGPETRGLPTSLLDRLPPAQRLRIPMRPDSRSLNLSNAAAVVVYEALRQSGFPGLD